MDRVNRELVESVEAIFAKPDDFETERAVEMFRKPERVQKKEDREARSNAWNGFVQEIRKRQKTVFETGVLTRGSRNKLVEMLELASYEWADRESGIAVPVTDICISGYQAFRSNDLGSTFSRNEPLSWGGPADIKGVQCEVLAMPSHREHGVIENLGIGIVATHVEEPDAFRGDELYIFVSADMLISLPTAQMRNTRTR